MGRYEDIRDAPASERPRLRAEALASLGPQVGASVTRGNFRLTLTDGPKLEGRLLVFSVRVNRVDNGLDVTPNTLNPIMVVNPPVLVADPLGPIDLGARGRFKLDLAGAMLDIVRGLLR